MGLVKVDAVVAGMVLAKPVVDLKGHLVLREGVTLSENHIKLLRAWKIPTVDVQGANESSLAELEARVANDAAAQQGLAHIERRFEGVQDPLLLAIRDIVKRRALARFLAP